MWLWAQLEVPCGRRRVHSHNPRHGSSWIPLEVSTEATALYFFQLRSCNSFDSHEGVLFESDQIADQASLLHGCVLCGLRQQWKTSRRAPGDGGQTCFQLRWCGNGKARFLQCRNGIRNQVQCLRYKRALVTGGLRGLGLRVAKWLADTGRRNKSKCQNKGVKRTILHFLHLARPLYLFYLLSLTYLCISMLILALWMPMSCIRASPLGLQGAGVCAMLELSKRAKPPETSQDIQHQLHQTSFLGATWPMLGPMLAVLVPVDSILHVGLC